LFFTMMSLTDGEKEFLENIYLQYSGRIYKFHYVKMQNAQDAECATMDTFVRIIQNADVLMGCSETEIARNINIYAMQVFLDAKRKQKRKENIESYSLDDTGEDEYNRKKEIADDCNLLNQLLHREFMDKLIEEIKKLDAKTQQIMLYKIQFDMRNKDIAEKMNMNQSTVNTIVNRLYKYFRIQMEDYINE